MRLYKLKDEMIPIYENMLDEDVEEKKLEKEQEI
jgi:hypothetical protein